jgi:outer membrane receptor protein involved in Fe transport
MNAVPAFAQLPTATIRGVVSDAAGAVLPGTTVTVRNTDTGLTRSVPTGGDGAYRMPALPVGPYEIRVELQGFRSAVRSGVRLVVGQEAVLDFTLELGAIQETVTVNADVTLVQTSTSALGSVITERQIAALPLEGRNYIGLTLMQPGVTESRTSGSDTYTGQWFSSSGAPPRSNSYLMDGTDLRNLTGVSTASVTGQTLGLDGIREYKVLTNAFPAEYGGAMGSQMVMVSKSGSNQFSGTLFQYYRSRALEAANYFDDPNQHIKFSRNNWGGSFGGPIRRDRIHFHATLEYARVRRGQTTISPTLPASAHTSPATAATVPLIALYPEPNLPNNRYGFTWTQPASDLYGQGRVDFTLTPSSTLFVRYTRTSGNTRTAGTFPGYDQVSKSRNQFATLSHNQILSPTIVNSARIAYSHPNLSQVAEHPDILLSDPHYNFVPGEAMGVITIGGVANLGPSANLPRAFEQRLWSFADDVNVTAGRSAWKFGVQVNRHNQYLQQSFQRGGQVTFANVAAFLNGTANFITAPSLGSFNAKTFDLYTFGLYAQNDLKVSRRLTLNLGLRYEPQTSYKEKFGRESAVRNLLTDNDATHGRMLLNNSKRNVSPRLGFAWDVTGDGKTAVRGAAARLFDLANLGTVLVQSVSGTPPYSGFSRVDNPASFSVPFQLPSATFGRSLRIVDYDLQQPKMWHYNVAVERELVRDMSLTVAYAGSRGSDLIRTAEGNPRPPSGKTADGRPFWTGNEARVAPQWDTVELKVADSTSRYNSLQISVNQRVRGGLTFQNSYTLSKAMDEYSVVSNVDIGGATTGTEAQAGPNPFDRGLDWGAAPWDIRHNYHFNLVYRVPDAFRAGSLLAGVLNTWQVATIIQATSGQPFTPGLTTNRSRSGVLGGPSGLDRPDVVSGVKLKDVTSGVSRGCEGVPAGTPVGTPEHWFDPCAFAIPPIGTIGNTPRNSVRGPGYSRVDLSFQKLVNVTRTSNVELRVDVFNVFNRVNFGIPNRIVYAARTDVEAPLATAGLITTADAGRQAQLSVRLSF